MPPALATVGTIVGANVAITLLWKFPPLWRVLNRFFVIVPMYPNALSVIGSTFSHQTWRHLMMNMMVLGIMGTRGKLLCCPHRVNLILINCTSSRRDRPRRFPGHVLCLWCRWIHDVADQLRCTGPTRHVLPRSECSNKRDRCSMVHVPLQVRSLFFLSSPLIQLNADLKPKNK